MSVSTTPGATALTRIPRAPRSEAKCFTRVSMAPLVAAYAGIVPTTARAAERRKKNDAATLRQDRKQLLHKKEGGANVDCEQPIEILNRGILDRCGFRDPRISDKDIEAIADDLAGDFRKLVRPIGRRQIGRDRVSAAAGLAYLGDDTVGFGRATAIMHENLRTRGGQRECAGAADTARGPCDQGGFSGEVGHDRSLCCLLGLDTYGAQGSAAERNIDTSRTNSSGYWWWEPCAESG